MQTTELNPEIAKKSLADASSNVLPVEDYLKKIIEIEDERLKMMREAMNDGLFLADLEEIVGDFPRADFE